MTLITVRVKHVEPRIVLERVLLAVGLICVTWYALATAQARYDEHQARKAVERLLEGAGSAGGAAGAAGAEGAAGAAGAEGAEDLPAPPDLRR